VDQDDYQDADGLLHRVCVSSFTSRIVSQVV